MIENLLGTHDQLYSSQEPCSSIALSQLFKDEV